VEEFKDYFECLPRCLHLHVMVYVPCAGAETCRKLTEAADRHAPLRVLALGRRRRSCGLGLSLRCRVACAFYPWAPFGLRAFGSFGQTRFPDRRA
jgi:hypothetical protein